MTQENAKKLYERVLLKPTKSKDDLKYISRCESHYGFGKVEKVEVKSKVKK